VSENRFGDLSKSQYNVTCKKLEKFDPSEYSNQELENIFSFHIIYRGVIDFNNYQEDRSFWLGNQEIIITGFVKELFKKHLI
jgi:hypothetical protein